MSLRWLIRLSMLTILFVTGFAQFRFASLAQDDSCHDFLAAIHKKPKSLIFQGCKPRPDLQDKPLEATYRVEGIHAAYVENYLMKELNLKELKKNCCLWESTENSFRDKNGRMFVTTMATEETTISSRNEWAKIPYFYVVVRLYPKEP